MKRALKHLLLQYGGYTTARKIYAAIEYRSLVGKYMRFLETGAAPLPDKVIFEPTQRCNLRCKMCFQDRGKMAAGKELTHEQITDFFRQNPYLRKVTLIGGEIFMRRDMMDLILHLNCEHDLVISTNGTLIGEAEIKALKKCTRLFTVGISLDGPRDVHDSIRQVKGSYDKAVSTIKALSPVLPVTANLVIQDENLRFIPEVVDLCASLGVKKFKIELERIYAKERRDRAIAATGLITSDIPLVAEGRSRGYTTEKLQDILRECRVRGKKHGIDIYINPLYLMDEITACYESNLLNAKKYICQNLHTVTIAPNGDVINCMQIRKPFGNILDTPLEYIWNSNTANAFRHRLLANNLSPLCENCTSMVPAPRQIVKLCQAL